MVERLVANEKVAGPIPVSRSKKGMLLFSAKRSMSKEDPVLYTSETRIFRSGIEKAGLEKPVLTLKDSFGNTAVTDGNHRSYRHWLQGSEPPQEQIGTVEFDITKSDNFRPVSKLIIIEK